MELKNPGRKKDPIYEEIKKWPMKQEKSIQGSGTLSIEKDLKERGVKISYNKIPEILKEGGMVMMNH